MLTDKWDSHDPKEDSFEAPEMNGSLQASWSGHRINIGNQVCHLLRFEADAGESRAGRITQQAGDLGKLSDWLTVPRP